MNFKGKQESTEQNEKYELVWEYMARESDLITFHPDQEIGEAIDIMLEKRISGGPVLNERHELVGMLSEKDCLKILIQSSYHNLPEGKGKVSDYMSSNVKTIDMETNVVEAANEFLNSHFRRFPVTHNGILKGQISRRDIMKAARKIKATTW